MRMNYSGMPLVDDFHPRVQVKFQVMSRGNAEVNHGQQGEQGSRGDHDCR
jgi:hypothetical protein